MARIAAAARELTRHFAIKMLQRKARLAYYRYDNRVGGMSCGRSMAEYISADVSEAKREFNDTMDRLAVLDPENCPKTRL